MLQNTHFALIKFAANFVQQLFYVRNCNYESKLIVSWKILF